MSHQLSLRFSPPGNFAQEARRCAQRSRWGLAGMDWEVHARKFDDYGYCYSYNSITTDFGRGWPVSATGHLSACPVERQRMRLSWDTHNLIMKRLRSLPELVVAKAIPLSTWPSLHECEDWWYEPIRVWPTTKRNGNYNSITPDFGRLMSIYDAENEGWGEVRFAKWEFIEVHKPNDQSKFTRLQALAAWRWTSSVALISPDEVEEFSRAVWRYKDKHHRNLPVQSVMDGYYMHHRWWVHPAVDRPVSFYEYWEAEAAKSAA